MRNLGLAALVVLVALSSVAAAAQETPPVEPAASPAPTAVSSPGPEASRPKLALVLSGGGARGAAHIGVLKVLEELHVVPDLIVGTSMGSIVGGLYATGWSAEEIEDYLKNLDWNQVFTDRVPRSEKSFRRKQDDWLYLIQAKLRFKGLRPYLPPGLLGGQRLDLMLKSLEFESTGQEDFDRFAIPYRAVAADIGTGEAVVIGKGNLATAMRASMSISGAFAPVEFGGRKLVDGGAVANLPVGIAQELGATRVIAVDISTPLDTKEQLGSFVSILNQMSGLLTVGNVEQDKKRLRPEDVFIRPQLGDIKFSDFKRAVEAIAIGESAARQQLDRLAAFRASDAAWADFERRRAERPPSDLTVERVDIRNTSWVADEVVRRRLDLQAGEKLDDIGLSQAVMRLSALDYFGHITPSFDRTSPNSGVLTLDIPAKPYGRNLLQGGLSIFADWASGRRSDSGFNLTARHQMLGVNRLGGELQNVIRIGQNAGLSSEFYQPLDYGMLWFVEPAVAIRRPDFKFWLDGQPVASYSITDDEVEVSIGRVFERWGEIRVTPFYAYTRADLDIGVPELPSGTEHDGGVEAKFSVDTVDAVMFPEHGSRVVVQYRWSLGDMGADAPNQRAAVAVTKSVTFGNNTFQLGAEGVRNNEADFAYRGAYFLGGIFRLSGLGDNELFGNRGALGRIVYYRKLTNLDLGPLSVRVYGGASFEAGGSYLATQPMTWSSLYYSGSIFAGATTPLGPAYLGYGLAEGGRDRFYFTIGREF